MAQKFIIKKYLNKIGNDYLKINNYRFLSLHHENTTIKSIKKWTISQSTWTNFRSIHFFRFYQKCFQYIEVALLDFTSCISLSTNLLRSSLGSSEQGLKVSEFI